MAAGIYPAPLVLWSCPGPPFPSPPLAPRVRAVRGLPGIFPATPLGLDLGQSLVQEGEGMGECAILQELTLRVDIPFPRGTCFIKQKH